MISQEKYKIMEENEVLVDNGPMAEKYILFSWLRTCSNNREISESYKYKNSLVEIDINDRIFAPSPI